MRQSWDKEGIQSLIDQSDVAVKRALIAIYRLQTEGEKASRATRHRNGVGFTAFDAPHLSSMAEWCIKNNRITPKMASAARKRVRKYWRQLLEIANGNVSQS